jgi:RNA polymerase sigma factor (sigma-70 family)
MPRRIEPSRTALADFEAIYDYIARDNPTAAAEVLYAFDWHRRLGRAKLTSDKSTHRGAGPDTGGRHGGARCTVCGRLRGGLGAQLPDAEETVLAVHAALEALEQADPRLAQVAQMRYFGGYSEQEIAETLEVTESTVQRDWEKARLIPAAALR